MNPSALIDRVIAHHPDWRGQTMVDIRRIIQETVPDVSEELKWRGAPTWSHNGILCICNAFKDNVKVTFINGAKLDMDRLFNAELGGAQWRAIKIFEGDTVNASGLKQLLVAAVAHNAAKGKGKAKSATAGGARLGKPAAAKAKPAKAARKSAKARRAARGARSMR